VHQGTVGHRYRGTASRLLTTYLRAISVARIPSVTTIMHPERPCRLQGVAPTFPPESATKAIPTIKGCEPQPSAVLMRHRKLGVIMASKYRCYVLDKNDRISSATSVEAADDAEALSKAALTIRMSLAFPLSRSGRASVSSVACLNATT
jgi:hypothetical protein